MKPKAKAAPSPPELVYYCSGSAPGSPAHLPRPQADELLQRDTAYVRRMESAGATDGHLPHIGGKCERCKT